MSMSMKVELKVEIQTFSKRSFKGTEGYSDEKENNVIDWAFHAVTSKICTTVLNIRLQI